MSSCRPNGANGLWQAGLCICTFGSRVVVLLHNQQLLPKCRVRPCDVGRQRPAAAGTRAMATTSFVPRTCCGRSGAAPKKACTAYRIALSIRLPLATGTIGPFATPVTRTRLHLSRTARPVLPTSLAGSGCRPCSSYQLIEP